MWRSRWRCVIKPAYSVSFLLSINIFVWQNVLYFPNDPRISIQEMNCTIMDFFLSYVYSYNLLSAQDTFLGIEGWGGIFHWTSFLHNMFNMENANCTSYSFVSHDIIIGDLWWCSWLRHCPTSQKVTGSFPDGVFGIIHWHNTSGCTVVLGSTQPLTEMSTRNIFWVV